MPQNEFMLSWEKRAGKRFDHDERIRKKKARYHSELSRYSRKVVGIKAKRHNQQRFKEKIEIKKKIRQHNQQNVKTSKPSNPNESAIPTYLMDRGEVNTAKILSNTIKQKRKSRAGRWEAPIQKVRGLTQDEVFNVVKTGKRRKKAWKRKITKVTFVPENFTRKPPKFERFIRPKALRFKKAHVTHPQLKTTFYLPILGVKKNLSSDLFSQLGVITKGTIIEVNTSELGLVTTSGRVVWGNYAQVTNNPELDGCINAVMFAG